MKWYEWFFVIVLIVFASAVSYGLSYKEINKPVYVVDLVKLIDEQIKESDIEKIYQKKIKPEDYLRQKREYLDKIQTVLETFDRPVFVKQAVVGGNIIDITEEVKKYIK